MVKKREQVLILSKGIFVTLVDFVQQWRERQQVQPLVVTLDGRVVPLPTPLEMNQADEFVYFLSQE